MTPLAHCDPEAPKSMGWMHRLCVLYCVGRRTGFRIARSGEEVATLLVGRLSAGSYMDL